MTADPDLLDEAVRHLWKLQPPTERCGCIGCLSMIQILYRNMLRERAPDESHVVRPNG